MPNNVNLTVELHAEDRARLDKIIELLGKTQPVVPAKAEAKLEEVKPEPVKEEVKPTVTIDDVRLLVQRLATPSSGKREAVRELVKRYADSVSAIPDDKLAEVHAELVKLDKGE